MLRNASLLLFKDAAGSCLCKCDKEIKYMNVKCIELETWVKPLFLNHVVWKILLHNNKQMNKQEQQTLSLSGTKIMLKCQYFL